MKGARCDRGAQRGEIAPDLQEPGHGEGRGERTGEHHRPGAQQVEGEQGEGDGAEGGEAERQGEGETFAVGALAPQAAPADAHGERSEERCQRDGRHEGGEGGSQASRC